MAGAHSYVSGLTETRRALRRLGREVGRELDQEAKDLAERVAARGRERTPVRSGAARRSIKVSITYRGIAVRSGLAYFGQHEYGRQIWLRRGLPYRTDTSRGTWFEPGRRGPVEMRQSRFFDGRVVNEARYLIPRRGMLTRSAAELAPVLEAEASRLVQRLTVRYGLD